MCVRRFPLIFCLIAGVTPLSRQAFSEESIAAAQPFVPQSAAPRWAKDVAVGFRTGGCFLSQPTNGIEFTTGLAVGAEIAWGVFAFAPHRAVLTVGFLDYSVVREKGTPEIRVTTHYARLDFSAGYDFTWRALVVGANVGYVLALNTVETTYGQPSWQVVDGEMTYMSPENPEVRDRVGTDSGLLAGLSIGLEVGEWLWGIEDLLEIRAKSDYTYRDGRNEITVLGTIDFWPTAFLYRRTKTDR
jgi:hypothetical protein